ncbi:NAD(+) diphosphatase [Microbacterium album]|uniref:NAD(+) diphosphatase n=1 Tax=Microbacterium album TaxID=2053191 RepID=A0A917IBA8_9MICO|nr:NAD(+) diphosphatase [Microbacterium album]GGH33213.1 NTP pyrophosphohydrolase [Microbacterium album]
MTRHAALATDRRAEERDVPGLVESLRADDRTRVIAVRGDEAPRAADPADGVHALFPRDVPEGAEWGFLGRDESGAGILVAAFDPAEPEPFPAPDGWTPLRRVGGELPPDAAETFVAAVSLGRWLVGHRFCPVCGSAAVLKQAGWSRVCEGCGREHFPRTDPAVIVAVTNADRSRLLLGANAAWGGRMHSCFAGFVESGESLETAIHREILEEAGVRVGDLRYCGSQPWPYPRSLMLGFEATAVDEGEARADGTEILSVRWFTRDEIGEGLAGRGPIGLPGPVSIAHRLIRSWYGDAAASPGMGER